MFENTFSKILNKFMIFCKIKKNENSKLNAPLYILIPIIVQSRIYHLTHFWLVVKHIMYKFRTIHNWRSHIIHASYKTHDHFNYNSIINQTCTNKLINSLNKQTNKGCNVERGYTRFCSCTDLPLIMVKHLRGQSSFSMITFVLFSLHLEKNYKRFKFYINKMWAG